MAKIMMTTSKIMMRLIVNIAAIYFIKMQKINTMWALKFKFRGIIFWLA